LDKLRRNFLWKRGKEEKGNYLVNWNTMMLNKSRGGLDIRNLKVQNESLLRKWLCRYINEERTLWKEVIVAKYGELNPWVSETVSMPYGWGVRRSIRALWDSMGEELTLKVGNGIKVSSGKVFGSVKAL